MLLWHCSLLVSRRFGGWFKVQGLALTKVIHIGNQRCHNHRGDEERGHTYRPHDQGDEAVEESEPNCESNRQAVSHRQTTGGKGGGVPSTPVLSLMASVYAGSTHVSRQSQLHSTVMTTRLCAHRT